MRTVIAAATKIVAALPALAPLAGCTAPGSFMQWPTEIPQGASCAANDDYVQRGLEDACKVQDIVWNKPFDISDKTTYPIYQATMTRCLAKFASYLPDCQREAEAATAPLMAQKKQEAQAAEAKAEAERAAEVAEADALRAAQAAADAKREADEAKRRAEEEAQQAEKIKHCPTVRVFGLAAGYQPADIATGEQDPQRYLAMCPLECHGAPFLGMYACRGLTTLNGDLAKVEHINDKQGWMRISLPLDFVDSGTHTTSLYVLKSEAVCGDEPAPQHYW
jgi:hypothetical protein